MLASAVVADLVAADELFTDRDLDGVVYDCGLDLAALVLRARVVVLAGEAHVPVRINLARHRHNLRRRMAPPATLGRADLGLGLLRPVVPSGVRRDEHTVVVDPHQVVVADDVDVLA